MLGVGFWIEVQRGNDAELRLLRRCAPRNDVRCKVFLDRINRINRIRGKDAEITDVMA